MPKRKAPPAPLPIEESQDRSWLRPDGTCIVCEEPAKLHTLQAQRDCRSEYLRHAEAILQEEERDRAMAKTDKKDAKKKDKKAGAPKGRAATVMPDGKTSVEVIDAALGGKSMSFTFDSPERAKAIAYTLWSLRRRRGAVEALDISLDSDTSTVKVGPRGTKEKKAKAEKPAKKVKADKPAKKAKAADAEKPKKRKKKKDRKSGAERRNERQSKMAAPSNEE